MKTLYIFGLNESVIKGNSDGKALLLRLQAVDGLSLAMNRGLNYLLL